jgi:hypothetical protein
MESTLRTVGFAQGQEAMSKLGAFATEKTVLSREAQQRGFLWVLLKTVPQESALKMVSRMCKGNFSIPRCTYKVIVYIYGSSILK